MDNEKANNADTTSSRQIILELSKKLSEEKRLLTELKEAENESQMMDAIAQIREDYQPTLDNWENLKRDEKRTILHTFSERIEINCSEKITSVHM